MHMDAIEPLRWCTANGPGGSWVVRDEHRPEVAHLIAYPSAGIVAAECRLAALVDGHIGSRRLAHPRELERGAELAARAFEAIGLELDPAAAMLTRMDATAELRFEDARHGIAFMRALAHADVPRLKTDAWRHQGRVETVYARGPRSGKALFRAYDKGIETGDAAPGERIRLERQQRFGSSSRRLVAEWTPADVAAGYLGALERLTVAPDLLVGSPRAIEDAILERVAAGDVTARVAERLLGTLRLFDSFGAGWSGWSTKTAQRRRRELRELGFALGPDQAPDAVPVGLLLDEFRGAWDLALAA